MLVVSNGVQANEQHKGEDLPSFRPSIEETLRAACLLIISMEVTISPSWRRGVMVWWLGLLDCDVTLLAASPSLYILGWVSRYLVQVGYNSLISWRASLNVLLNNLLSLGNL